MRVVLMLETLIDGVPERCFCLPFLLKTCSQFSALAEPVSNPLPIFFYILWCSLPGCEWCSLQLRFAFLFRPDTRYAQRPFAPFDLELWIEKTVVARLLCSCMSAAQKNQLQPRPTKDSAGSCRPARRRRLSIPRDREKNSHVHQSRNHHPHAPKRVVVARATKTLVTAMFAGENLQMNQYYFTLI